MLKDLSCGTSSTRCVFCVCLCVCVCVWTGCSPVVSCRCPVVHNFLLAPDCSCVLLFSLFGILFTCCCCCCCCCPPPPQVTLNSQHQRHHRFCLRLMLKNPDNHALCVLCGHNAMVSGSFKHALGARTHTHKSTHAAHKRTHARTHMRTPAMAHTQTYA